MATETSTASLNETNEQEFLVEQKKKNRDVARIYLPFHSSKITLKMLKYNEGNIEMSSYCKCQSEFDPKSDKIFYSI